MLNNMVEVRNEPRFTHGENADRIAKAFIISSQLALGDSKNREVPVAEELHHEPKDQNGQQNPFSRRWQKMVKKQSNAVQAQGGKLSAFDAHSFDKRISAESIGRCAAKKPYP